MRLLIVSQDFPPAFGGIQTYAFELAQRMAPRLDALHVIAPDQPGAAAFDADLPFAVHRLPLGSDLLPIPALRAVAHVARSERIDVVLHAQWQPVFASVRSRSRSGWPRRILLPAHGREVLYNPWPGPGAAVYERWRRWSFKSADVVLPVSRYNADLVRRLGVSNDRLKIINNGTDPNIFYPESAEGLRRDLSLNGKSVIVQVGRLIERKGYDTVIRSLPEVSNRLPDVHYVVVGDGPDRSRLERLARDIDVADKVTFAGLVPYNDLRPYYNLGDVVVMAARSVPPEVEGFGIVFLEANACGKPVIGADSGGIPDAVVHEQTGLLVSPSNSSEMARALHRLLGDSDFAQRLGRAGRDRVLAEMTWDHVAGRILDAAADSLGQDRDRTEHRSSR